MLCRDSEELVSFDQVQASAVNRAEPTADDDSVKDASIHEVVIAAEEVALKSDGLCKVSIIDEVEATDIIITNHKRQSSIMTMQTDSVKVE